MWIIFYKDTRQNILVLLVVTFGSGPGFGIFYPFCEKSKEGGHYPRWVTESSARARMWLACVSRLRAMRCVTGRELVENIK